MQILSIEQRIYVGTIGAVIDLVVVDYDYTVPNLTTLLGAGGVAQMIIQQPDGTVLTKSATIAGTTSNIIRYTSAAGDFDDPGIYSFHGKLLNESVGLEKCLYTEPVDIQVRNLFDEEEIPVTPEP